MVPNSHSPHYLYTGNEEPIAHIYNRIKQLLVEKNYFNNQHKADAKFSTELRRITFYLMLNTSANHAFSHQDLNNAAAIVHLLNHSAQLSPCLLLSLVWSLDLGVYFAEAIGITPHWFAWPFLREAVATLKHADARRVPSIVEQLVVAIYKNIARSDSERIEEPRRAETLQNYHDFVLALLTFMAPDEERMTGWTKLRRSKYVGRMVFRLLGMVSRCAAIFCDGRIAWTHIDADLVFGCLKGNIVDSAFPARSEAVTGKLHQLNVLLLNTLQANLKTVTVFTFMDWCEVDIDDEMTLQRQIGEAAFAVEQLIMCDHRFAHDILDQLKSISMRPKTLPEVIREATLGEIMSKLDSLALEPEIRLQWLDEFVSRGNLVLDNDECLGTLEGNVDHMRPVHVQALMRGLVEFSGTLADSSGDKLREIVIQTARRLSVDEIKAVILFSLEVQADGVDLEQPTLRTETIQLLNRCSEATFSSAQPLIILLQNPTRFFDQLLTTALVADLGKNIICNFIDSLAPQISQRFVQRSLLTLVNRCDTMRPDDVKRLTQLIVRLHTTQFTPRAIFFKQFYKWIADASRIKSLVTTTCLAEGLLAILRAHATPESTTALLVMCAILVDHSRWELHTFDARQVHLVETLIDIIHELRKRLLPFATANDKAFVLQRVSHLKASTRFYVHKLFIRPDETAFATWPQPADFARFVMGGPDGGADVDLAALPKDVLLVRMFGAVVKSTRKECVLLAHYELLRPHWFHAIRLVSRMVGKVQRQEQTAQSGAAVECLRHCGQMLASVVKVSSITKNTLLQTHYNYLVPIPAGGSHANCPDAAGRQVATAHRVRGPNQGVRPQQRSGVRLSVHGRPLCNAGNAAGAHGNSRRSVDRVSTTKRFERATQSAVQTGAAVVARLRGQAVGGACCMNYDAGNDGPLAEPCPL